MRLAAYVREMFHPAIAVPAGVANLLAIHLSLQALAGLAPLSLTWRMIPAAATAVLCMLLLRIQDELKDAESDLALGRAGDPRFSNRALVAGRVTLRDLRVLRGIVMLSLVVINLPLGFPWPLVAFAILLVAIWLSSRWFFCPAISRHLLLAFVTHNPLALLVSGYVVAVFVRDTGDGHLTRFTVPLLLALWLPVAAWETGRKIRLPADETAYQTYSKVLGLRAAALTPAAFLAASTALLVPVSRAMGLAWPFACAVILAALAALFGSILLIVAPAPARANLRPYAELHAAVSTIGLCVALVLRYGLE